MLAAKNYALYYGHGRERELSQFDMAIVEPLGQTSVALKKIQEAGTLVLAYLSIMEIHSDSLDVDFLKEEDLLAGPGGPLKNEQYGNWIVDLRSKRWNHMLRQKVESLLCAGYDGIFLDTIADVELVPVSPDCRTELIFAAAGFIADIKKEYCEHVIVQNNGVERLCLMTAKLIDGICWENPPFDKTESAAWLKEVIRRLKRLHDEEKIAVFLLMQKENEARNNNRNWRAREVANQHGFLFYEAPRDYVAGVNTMSKIKSP